MRKCQHDVAVTGTVPGAVREDDEAIQAKVKKR